MASGAPLNSKVGLDFCGMKDESRIDIAEDSVQLKSESGFCCLASTQAVGVQTKDIQAVHTAVGGRKLYMLVLYWTISGFLGGVYYLMVPVTVDNATDITGAESAAADRVNNAFQFFFLCYILSFIIWFFSRTAFAYFAVERVPEQVISSRANPKEINRVTDTAIRDMLYLAGKPIDPALAACAEGDDSAKEARWAMKIKNTIQAYICVPMGESQLKIGRHYLHLKNTESLFNIPFIAAKYLVAALTSSVVWVRRSEAPKYKLYQVRYMLLFTLFVSLYTVGFSPANNAARWGGTLGALWALVGVFYYLSRRYHVAVALQDQSRTELQVDGEDNARLMVTEIFSQKFGYDASQPVPIKSWMVKKCFGRQQQMITLYNDRLEFYSQLSAYCSTERHTYSMALKDIDYVHAEVAGASKRIRYAAFMFGSLAFAVGFVMHFMVQGVTDDETRNVMAVIFGLFLLDVIYIIVVRPTFLYIGTSVASVPGGASPFTIQCTTVGQTADEIMGLIMAQAKCAKDCEAAGVPNVVVELDQASIAEAQEMFREQYAWAPAGGAVTVNPVS